jgi:VWFA-related protein
MRSWRFLSMIVALLAAGLVHAQVPARPSPGPPSNVDPKINPQAVLRSETRLVQLNVVVQNGKGHLVEDLKKEDFTLLDNGKPQDIALFSSEPATPSASSTGTRTGTSDTKSDLAPNEFGNRLYHAEQAPGNVTVLLFDALNTSFSDQAYARTQILGFLRQLQSQDHVAIYLLTTRLMVVNEFTQDSNSLLQAVERFQASPSLLQTDASQSHFTASDSGIPNFKGAQRLANMMNDMNSNLGDLADAKRVEITAHAIEAIANHVTSIPGRKSLVWVSGSFPLSISLRSNDNSPVDSQSQNFMPALERVARALNQSNLAIYPVDARGLISNTEFDTSNAHPYSSENPAVSIGAGQDEQLTMKLLAERTGGHAFSNTNDIKGAIRRTLADSQFTYVVGYYPDHGKWNGAYHTLLLRVKKSGAVLRYRKGYFALADPPDTLSETQDALQAATWSPVDAPVSASKPGLRQSIPLPGNWTCA